MQKEKSPWAKGPSISNLEGAGAGEGKFSFKQVTILKINSKRIIKILNY